MVKPTAMMCIKYQAEAGVLILNLPGWLVTLPAIILALAISSTATKPNTNGSALLFVRATYKLVKSLATLFK